MGGNFCQAFYTSVFTHQVVFFLKNYLALLIFVVLLAYLFFPAGGIPLLPV